MPLRTLAKFRNTDITSDFNHRLRYLARKGVFFGGQVSPISGQLKVQIQPFAAVGNDGMVTLLEGSPEEVNVSAGTIQYVLLHAVYNPNQAPTAAFEVLTVSAYTALTQVNKDARVILAKVDVLTGSTEVDNSKITYIDAEQIDPQTRSPFRGRVATETALPDYTDPPTGLTTVNRQNDFYFVDDDKLFFHWDISGTPQWREVISAAEAVALANHKLNLDDGSVAPEFYEAQHITVDQRESLDAGSASQVKYAANGVPFSSTNPIIDKKLPWGYRTYYDPGSLVSVTAVQIVGSVYVGKDGLGTANKFVRLAQFSDPEKQYVGSDKNPITVLAIYDSTNSFELTPTTDANYAGYYTNPYVRLDFTQTIDAAVSGQVALWYYAASVLGDTSPQNLFDRGIFGLVRPARDIPVSPTNFAFLSGTNDDAQQTFDDIDAKLVTMNAANLLQPNTGGYVITVGPTGSGASYTGSDHTPFNSAIAAARALRGNGISTGVQILVLPGIYSFTTAVTLTSVDEGITISGLAITRTNSSLTNVPSLRVSSSYRGPIFSMTNVYDITFENLEFHDTGSSGSGGTDFKLKWVDNSASTITLSERNFAMTVRNCQFTGDGSAPFMTEHISVRATGTSTDRRLRAVVEDCYFEPSNSAASYGVYFQNIDWVVFQRNYISQIHTSAVNGFMLLESVATNSTRLWEITDNITIAPSTVGVAMSFLTLKPGVANSVRPKILIARNYVQLNVVQFLSIQPTSTAPTVEADWITRGDLVIEDNVLDATGADVFGGLTNPINSLVIRNNTIRTDGFVLLPAIPARHLALENNIIYCRGVASNTIGGTSTRTLSVKRNVISFIHNAIESRNLFITGIYTEVSGNTFTRAPGAVLSGTDYQAFRVSATNLSTVIESNVFDRRSYNTDLIGTSSTAEQPVIQTDSGAKNVNIFNNLFLGVEQAGAGVTTNTKAKPSDGAFIRMIGTTNVRIANNTMFGAKVPIYTKNGEAVSTDGIIEGNFIQDCLQAIQLHFGTGTGGDRFKIVNNNIDLLDADAEGTTNLIAAYTNVYSVGIYCGNECIIDGNTISNAPDNAKVATTTNTHLVFINDDGVVSRNRIANVGHVGEVVWVDGDRTKVLDNYITDIGLLYTGSGSDSVGVWVNAADCTVANNVIQDLGNAASNLKYGVRLNTRCKVLYNVLGTKGDTATTYRWTVAIQGATGGAGDWFDIKIIGNSAYNMDICISGAGTTGNNIWYYTATAFNTFFGMRQAIAGAGTYSIVLGNHFDYGANVWPDLGSSGAMGIESSGRHLMIAFNRFFNNTNTPTPASPNSVARKVITTNHEAILIGNDIFFMKNAEWGINLSGNFNVCIGNSVLQIGDNFYTATRPTDFGHVSMIKAGTVDTPIIGNMIQQPATASNAGLSPWYGINHDSGGYAPIVGNVVEMSAFATGASPLPPTTTRCLVLGALPGMVCLGNSLRRHSSFTGVTNGGTAVGNPAGTMETVNNLNFSGT